MLYKECWVWLGEIRFQLHSDFFNIGSKRMRLGDKLPALRVNIQFRECMQHLLINIQLWKHSTKSIFFTACLKLSTDFWYIYHVTSTGHGSNNNNMTIIINKYICCRPRRDKRIIDIFRKIYRSCSVYSVHMKFLHAAPYQLF